QGTPHELLARRMVEILSGHALYATSPSWDGKWLSVLLRGAGLPRHALRVREADEAHLAAAAAILRDARPEEDVACASVAILASARDTIAQRPPAHRALPDAMRELEVWHEVARLPRG